ncbi:MAG: hypothetical protein U1G07_23150 [Verrucomicrobiota bacterium]
MKPFLARPRTCFAAVALGLAALAPASWGVVNVALTEVPDYQWSWGCFGTATGNLMGYWDRHGFPNFYTGPTGGGVAPLTSTSANASIYALWASRAGVDGRPADLPGHCDDYWIQLEPYSYEDTGPDPYVLAGRPEHEPDCIGDFIGLSQNKWPDLNGECQGNIDAFSFVFWDATGDRRANYVPTAADGTVIPDIPSGLRAWTRYRGSDAMVFSQLTDFNPTVGSGHGFTFEDMKAEIDAGYPVLLFLQRYDQLSRALPGMPRANPEMHGMLAYGYYITDDGDVRVRYKTSWGSSGDLTLSRWTSAYWQAELPVRGVIAYHPLPRITQMRRTGGALTVEWEGPDSVLTDFASHTTTRLHSYVLEKAPALNPSEFSPVAEPTTERSVTIPDCCPAEAGFFRLRLVTANVAQ